MVAVPVAAESGARMTLTTAIEGQRADYLNQLAEDWYADDPRPLSLLASLCAPPGVRPPPTPAPAPNYGAAYAGVAVRGGAQDAVLSGWALGI